MPNKEEKQERGLNPRRKDQKDYQIPQGRSWFFGIGINQYQEFSGLSNAVKDLEDIRSLLAEKYDIEPEYSFVLTNEEATREAIIGMMDQLVEQVEQDDKLIIYYSGHGHLNKRTELGYWIPHDARKNQTANYIRNSTILDYIKVIKARHTLLISDSCFSGSLFVPGSRRADKAIDELEQLKSKWAICSGRHDEQVFDGDPGKNSPFAASILRILDSNRLAKLNAAKLADRVMELTYSRYKQLARGSSLFSVGDDGGQYVFRLKKDDESYWATCLKENSVAAFYSYLTQFSEGNHRKEAERIIKDLEDEAAWEDAQEVDKVFKYLSYLRGFPDGKFQVEAEKRIEELGSKMQPGAHQTFPAAPSKKEQPTEERPSTEVSSPTAPQKKTDRTSSWARMRNPSSPSFDKTKIFAAGLSVVVVVLIIYFLNSIFNSSDPSTPSPGGDSPVKELTIESNWSPPGLGDLWREDKLWIKVSGGKAPYMLEILDGPTQKKTLSIPASEAENFIFSIRDIRPTDKARQYTLRVTDDDKNVAETGEQFDRRRASPAVSSPKPAITPPEPNTVRDRDGNEYRTIELAGRTWLAKNLSYKISDSWCYDFASSCAAYGRLYTWQSAKKACAALGSGWRLPRRADWDALNLSLGGYNQVQGDGSMKQIGGSVVQAYNALRKGGKSGFNASLEGRRDENGNFNERGNISFYWVDWEFELDPTNSAWAWMIMETNPIDKATAKSVGPFFWPKSNAHSCRCVKD